MGGTADPRTNCVQMLDRSIAGLPDGVEQIPTGRARKRRTIPKHQLALALDGKVEAVYGYSFVLTNLDLGDPAQDVDEHAVNVAEAEYWYRHRTDIEELNRNAKHGTALRHAPSGHHAVNSVWMWAGLLGCAISAWLQELTGIDNGRGRYTVARLARELINLPAHITRHGGIIYLRLPPGPNLLTTVLPLLQSLPRPG